MTDATSPCRTWPQAPLVDILAIPCIVTPMTQTGTATAARTLSAPVRVVRELGVDRLEVVTLPGGRGGWATPGKTLVIGRAIFTPDA